jgi:hypothetical protein
MLMYCKDWIRFEHSSRYYECASCPLPNYFNALDPDLVSAGSKGLLSSPLRRLYGDARTFSISLLSSILYDAFARAQIRDSSGSDVRASSRRPDMCPNKRFKLAMTCHDFVLANFTASRSLRSCLWQKLEQFGTLASMHADVVVEIEDSARLIRDERGAELAWACGLGEMR